MEFNLVEDTINKACDDQEWKYKQCIGESSDLKYPHNL